MSVDVVVVWARAAPSVALTGQLVGTVARELTGSGDAVTHTHLCPRCGSDAHGRPVLTGRRDLGISVAHTDEVTAVAGVEGTSVGVDLEPVGVAGRPSIAAVLLHPHEHAGDAEELTRTWVRKESLLKALGTGLSVDPREVELTGPGEAPQARRLPAPFGDVAVRMQDLGLGASHVGCVSVLSTAAPVVRVVRLVPAEPEAPAR